MAYVSKHFEDWELLPESETDISLIDEKLLMTIDEARDILGVPCTINNYKTGGTRQWCGLRTEACTEGAPKSMHREGKAADLHPEGIAAEDARQILLKASEEGKLQYLGRMEANVDWVHVDLGNRVDGKVHLFIA